MRSITTKVYKFSELSKKAKQVALDVMRYTGYAECDSSTLTEMFEDTLNEQHGMGAWDLQVHWSLGYCQGDGVVFSGTPDIDEMAKHDEWLSAKLKEWFSLHQLQELGLGWFVVRIEADSRYTSCNCMTVTVQPCDDWGHDFQEWELEVSRQLEQHLKQRVESIANELMKAGYAEIEYYQSDETLGETLDANDVEFDKQGNPI